MLGNFSFPEILPASGMLKLAKSIDSELDELLFKDVRLPELPPRDITTILNLAEAGLHAEISVLEWISLLNGKEHWDSTHFNQERSSNQLIWQLACRNHGLRYLLYWRLALHLDGHDVSFPRGLIRQFQHFQQNLLEVDKLRTSLLAGMYSGDTASLCRSTLSLRMLPSAVLAKCGLPAQVAFSQKALKELARYWVEHAKEFDAEVLFTVVSKLKPADKDTFFSSALVDIPSGQLEQHKALVNKIISAYSPYVKDSRFAKLSQAAQQVVRDLIGAMSFGDFSKLIAKLTKPEVANKLGLEEREIRQLNSRVAFWSNYQSRFLGFSVYLPSATYTLLKQLNFHTDDMVFHQLCDASCEVCVLEFENHYVLEFLRGGSSGVRIIDKNSQEAQLLKNVGSVSSQQQLEAIPFLAEHDHLKYWQNSCEQMLRRRFAIIPDLNLRRFVINDNFVMDYSSKNGLPLLTFEKQLERAKILATYFKRINSSFKTFYCGQLVTHKSRGELGKGVISFLYNDHTVDVQFETAKFSKISVGSLISTASDHLNVSRKNSNSSQSEPLFISDYFENHENLTMTEMEVIQAAKDDGAIIRAEVEKKYIEVNLVSRNLEIEKMLLIHGYQNRANKPLTYTKSRSKIE